MSKGHGKRIRGRDYFLVALIKGATKSGIHKDRKKDHCRRACRSAASREESYHGEEEAVEGWDGTSEDGDCEGDEEE